MKNKNDLQFFWDTAVHDKILTATISAQKKALEGALRAHFVYIPGTAILSLAFRDSTRMINSGINGLKADTPVTAIH